MLAGQQPGQSVSPVATLPDAFQFFPLAFCLDAMQAVSPDRPLQVSLRLVDPFIAAIESLHGRNAADQQKAEKKRHEHNSFAENSRHHFSLPLRSQITADCFNFVKPLSLKIPLAHQWVVHAL